MLSGRVRSNGYPDVSLQLCSSKSNSAAQELPTLAVALDDGASSQAWTVQMLLCCRRCQLCVCSLYQHVLSALAGGVNKKST
jgi:hypothetical protein